MAKFKVRCYDVGMLGIFTQSDAYEDYEFSSDTTLERFAKEICHNGFRSGNKWISPSSIVWVEEL